VQQNLDHHKKRDELEKIKMQSLSSPALKTIGTADGLWRTTTPA